MNSNLGIPFENEAVLAVYSNNPKQVMEALIAMPSLQNYKLVVHPSKHIHDIYFDTPSTSLKDKKMALRLRHEDSRQLITLKGPTESFKMGIHKRPELELPWSIDAINKIVDELQQVDIHLDRNDMNSYIDDPVGSMIRIGFEIIQDRETYRRIRIITLNDELKSGIVELDIDSTVYHFDNQHVHYHNLETEEKSAISNNMLDSIVDDIIQRFPKSLKRWSYSKLATGKAISKMLDEGSLKNLLNEHDELTTLALDRIDSMLRSKLA
jgi:hypothetical protein